MPLTIAERRQNLPVDEQGFILLGEQKLTQREAAILAYGLIDAAERSINRTQTGTPGYFDSRSILKRMESPLGLAKLTIGKLF